MSTPSNRRVLIIDDTASIHDDFRKIIGHRDRGNAIELATTALFDDAPAETAATAGFELDSAYQGEEGLARVQQSVAEKRPYAVAFVDVRMPPGWDGVETIRRIWEVDNEVQIVLCSAYSDYSWGETIRRLGESDRLLILKKPFDNVEVRQLAHALSTKWALSRQAQRTVDDLQEMVRQRTHELETSQVEIVWRLAKAAEHRDEETGNHVVRVSLYSRLIADAMKLEQKIIDTLFLAAPLHDIGKIGIPDSILLKAGSLNEEERRMMKTHCQIGYEILHGQFKSSSIFRGWAAAQNQAAESCQNPMLKMAASIALAHHEKWDGSGYPKGLHDIQIPLEARIVAVSDVFDALTSNRPYKRAIPFAKAREIVLNDEGRHFDPAVCRAFKASATQIASICEALADKNGRPSHLPQAAVAESLAGAPLSPACS